MLILLQDAQKEPRIFFLFGAIPAAELQGRLRRTGLALPSDLIELWQLTGGGATQPCPQPRATASSKTTLREEKRRMPKKES